MVPVAGEEAPTSVAVEAPNDVEEGEEGRAAQKMDEVEDEDKDEKDNEDEDASGDDDDDEKGNDASDYAPGKEGSEGTINLADDAVAPDNPPDKVKAGQKVSSPFDHLIHPITRTLLVKKGKKEKKVPDGDEESLLLLSDEEAPPLRSQKKKELATKLPTAGSGRKVGTTSSSKDVLMMIKGFQEEFFNLPCNSYVSAIILFTFLFMETFM